MVLHKYTPDSHRKIVRGELLLLPVTWKGEKKEELWGKKATFRLEGFISTHRPAASDLELGSWDGGMGLSSLIASRRRYTQGAKSDEAFLLWGGIHRRLYVTRELRLTRSKG